MHHLFFSSFVFMIIKERKSLEYKISPTSRNYFCREFFIPYSYFRAFFFFTYVCFNTACMLLISFTLQYYLISVCLLSCRVGFGIHDFLVIFISHPSAHSFTLLCQLKCLIMYSVLNLSCHIIWLFSHIGKKKQ